jgi:hypothetical protein
MTPRAIHAPFFGAYLKGHRAGCEGLKKKNPYKDLRGHTGFVTYSRGWQKIWDEGYEDGKAGNPLRYRKKVKA